MAGARREGSGRPECRSSSPPYLELLDRLPGGDAAGADVDDIRDLQLWTLLLAIEPGDIRDDVELHSLARRARGFSELDKVLVDAHQLTLLQAVIPAYRAAVSEGRLEAMTSPFHHPILPLLIDAGSARVAAPGIDIPSPPLRAPFDADEQVRSGLAEFARVSGHVAAGMWPPECAVSPEAAALMHACGARFAVSDEGVLARTLDVDDVRAGGELYRAYREASGLQMVFRDAQLSNLVGFTYQSMPAADAAADLLARLEQVAAEQADDQPGGLVTIALDGENFKDFYDDNATPFLDAFYTGLASSPSLRSTHIGAFLDEHAQTVQPLPQLWTGSWIDADLRTWIGEPAHTRAWTMLASARDALDHAGGAAAHPAAHRELLIAQASDWFWWFGRHHDSGSDAAWDALYRVHLRNAYELAGIAVPDDIGRPVVDPLEPGHDCAPLRSIDPPSAGVSEWLSAGTAEVGAALGSMRPPASSVSRVLYGAGGGRLHLRFGDSQPGFDRAVIDAGPAGQLVVERAVRNLAIALRNDAADFSVLLEEWERGAERVPAAGTLHVKSPPPGTGRPLRVLIAAVECAPLATSGLLAGAVADTVAAAADLGHDVVLAIPRHRGAQLGEAAGIRVAQLRGASPGRVTVARVLQGALPETGVPVLSIDAPIYFDRDSPYGDPDDGERYLAFCALVEALLRATAFAPDIVHGFEWQTAALLDDLGAGDDPPATVFSVADDSPGYLASDVDLLELGRRAATVTAPSRPAAGLASIYGSALELAASRA